MILTNYILFLMINNTKFDLKLISIWKITWNHSFHNFIKFIFLPQIKKGSLFIGQARPARRALAPCVQNRKIYTKSPKSAQNGIFQGSSATGEAELPWDFRIFTFSPLVTWIIFQANFHRVTFIQYWRSHGRSNLYGVA